MLLEGHLLAGIVSYPIFVTIYVMILNLIGFDLAFLNPLLFLIGYVLFIIGSDLPDIDSASSPIRKLAFAFLTITLLGVIYCVLVPYLSDNFQIFVLINISMSIFGFSIFKILRKYVLTKHKIIHNFILPIVYFLIIFSVSLFIPFDEIWNLIIESSNFKGLGKINNAIYLGLSGYTGVYLHLIVDKISSFLKRF